MTDVRAGEVDDDDRLPWLEAVEDEDQGDGPSPLKLVAAVVIGLLAIGLVVGGLFWLGNRGGQSGTELIEAPDGAYKVAPEDPGGMQVGGEGDTSHAASQGAEPRGSLNMNVAEAPVAQGQQPGAAPPQGRQQPQQPAAQQPAQPAQGVAPAASGPGIQLGAFSSQQSAQAAWAALSRRFTYLAPLSHSVSATQVGGRTLYRLRASGAGSTDICRRLQVAGEECRSVD